MYAQEPSESPEKMLKPCRDADPEIFFPEKGDEFTSKRAKAVCQMCLVQFECLTVALVNHEPGIWGGTSEHDRKKLRRDFPDGLMDFSTAFETLYNDVHQRRGAAGGT